MTGDITAGPRPDASVVIVTRDRPELLRRCIEGIRSQDHPGVVETVVVFDQSEVDTRSPTQTLDVQCG